MTKILSNRDFGINKGATFDLSNNSVLKMKIMGLQRSSQVLAEN
jgi:hypothetical protein